MTKTCEECRFWHKHNPNQGTCLEQEDIPTVTAAMFGCANFEQIEEHGSDE